MPLVKIKQKFQVTIPDALRKAARLSVGDYMEVEEKNNTIVLKPKAIVDRATANLFKERMRDLKAGRLTPAFSNSKEFRKYLKKRK
ncbi:MAG: AbrB/MazE/SpoVT family DNA-binding domain-containing protein [Patescibacteria group bacterium]